MSIDTSKHSEAPPGYWSSPFGSMAKQFDEQAWLSINGQSTPFDETFESFEDRAVLINRLKEIERVPFVTFVDTENASLFFGINSDGHAGVFLEQRGSSDREDSGPERFPPRLHSPSVSDP